MTHRDRVVARRHRIDVQEFGVRRTSRRRVEQRVDGDACGVARHEACEARLGYFFAAATRSASTSARSSGVTSVFTPNHLVKP